MALMKKTCTRYTPEDISRFIDNELSQHLCGELEQHLNTCPDCSRLVEQYQTLSAVFSDHADNKGLKIDPDALKQKHESVAQASPNRILGNIYMKLASVAAILMISLYAFQGNIFRSTGPSAIVTSVDTNVSSVMIIETQKKHHTIIWFSET